MQKYFILLATLILLLYKSQQTTQKIIPKKMIYFIRHAESRYNLVEAQIKNKYGEQYMKTVEYQTAKFSMDYLDVEITELGIQQCLQAREKMKDIHVDYVIVSPLRRALKTCSLVFENHPSNPQIIVNPDFREILCSSNDIGSYIEQSIKNFPRYDFSLITDPDFWYLLNIQDQQIRDRLLTNLKQAKYESKKQAAIAVTLEFLKGHFEARQADPQNQELVKKVLPSLAKQQEYLLEKLQKYRSIAVVSHSENIKSYVGYKIKNCQVYPFTQERLQKLPTK